MCDIEGVIGRVDGAHRLGMLFPPDPVTPGREGRPDERPQLGQLHRRDITGTHRPAAGLRLAPAPRTSLD